MRTSILLVSYLLIFSLCFLSKAKAQITLEYSNDTMVFGEIFYVFDIAPNESKYVLLNRSANSFSMFNMDMTPFITNITIPVTDSLSHGFTVGPISRTLFDCDSSNIEYVFQSPYIGIKPFRIIRTDGTILFARDSAIGPYCFGCWGGTNDIRPIRRTSAGTKLFLDILNPSGRGIEIYSLCGELTGGTTNNFDFPYSQQLVKVYPNPSNSFLTFEVMPPNNMDEFSLSIFDLYGKELFRERIYGVTTVNVNISSFISGNYLFSLAAKDKLLESGKITITR